MGRIKYKEKFSASVSHFTIYDISEDTAYMVWIMLDHNIFSKDIILEQFRDHI